MLINVGEPSSYHEAISVHDHAKWQHAMQSDLDGIQKNGTWDLVCLPKATKALPCKWVYKNKHNR